MQGFTITIAMASEAKFPNSESNVFKKPLTNPIIANTAKMDITIMSKTLTAVLLDSNFILSYLNSFVNTFLEKVLS